MSRTTDILENPAVKTLKWKNRKEEIQKDSKGKAIKDETGKLVTKVERETGWYYWDKSLNDGEGGEVKVDMPLVGIWLETSNSIMGYSKNAEKGIYSNEVLDLKSQELVVKCGNDILAKGLYNSIKDDVKGQGGKFCSAVYALVEVTDREYEIWRFLMAGSSNSAWITYSNRIKNKTHAFVFYDTNEKFTPKGDMYEEPVLKYIVPDEDFLAAADKAATELVDPFFKFYLSKPAETLSTVTADEDDD